MGFNDTANNLKNMTEMVRKMEKDFRKISYLKKQIGRQIKIYFINFLFLTRDNTSNNNMKLAILIDLTLLS